MNRLIYSGNEETIELNVNTVDGKMFAAFSSRQRILCPISRERKSIPRLIYNYGSNENTFVGGIVPSTRIEDSIITVLSDVTFLVASGIPAVTINVTLNLSNHIADQDITKIFRDICEDFCHNTSGMFDIDVSHSSTSTENVLKRHIKLTVTRRALNLVWYENGECYAEDVAKRLMVHVWGCYIRANLLCKYIDGTTQIVDSIDLWGNYDNGYISATTAIGYDILVTPYGVYFYGKWGYTRNYRSLEFANLNHREVYKAISNELSKDERIMKSVDKETYFDNISKEFTFKKGEIKK